MLGINGPTVPSKTLWMGKGKERIDVENPAPERERVKYIIKIIVTTSTIMTLSRKLSLMHLKV